MKMVQKILKAVLFSATAMITGFSVLLGTSVQAYAVSDFVSQFTGLFSETPFSQYLYMDGEDCRSLTDGYTDVEIGTAEGYYTYKKLTKDVEISGYVWTMVYTYFTDIQDTDLVPYDEYEITGTSAVFKNEEGLDDSEILDLVSEIYSKYDYLDEQDEYISCQWDSVEGGDYDVELILSTSDGQWTLYFLDALNEDWGDPSSLAEAFNSAKTKDEIVELTAFIDLDDPYMKEEYDSYAGFSLNISDVSEGKRLSRENQVIALTDIYGFSAALISAGLSDCELESHIYMFTAHVDAAYTCLEDGEEYSAEDSDDYLAAVGYSDGWKLYALRYFY
ncbi:MAG: hypothetical protein LUF78_00805 [Clostridiales bacterium]|nr:hypothetical protein [Clostridiales bacterium]